RQHSFGAARVEHDGLRRWTQRKSPIERRDHAAVFAGAAVFGREREVDAERAKEIEIEELGRSSRTVEQRCADTAGAQRFGERRERRQADAAGDHPRLGRWLDDGEWTSERTEASDNVAWPRIVDQARRRADAFAENREAGGCAVCTAQNLEHRERTA